jgi:hypothetical protein
MALATGYSQDMKEAIALARSMERTYRGMKESVLHDLLVKTLQDADFSLEIAIRASWEALSD